MRPTECRVSRANWKKTAGLVDQLESLLGPARDHLDRAGDDPAAIEAALHALTPGQRWLQAIQAYEMGVNSGGHDGYLRFGGGTYAPEALAGLRQVGAAKFAAVLEGAIRLFPGGVIPRDMNERAELLDAALEKHGDALGELNGKFYDSYDGEESLAKACMAYVAAHPAEFFVD